MSAVLETYFQHVVVDKLNETITKQFEEMREDLQVIKQLKSDYSSLRTELDTLKQRFSESGNEINEMLAKTSKKAVATKKPATTKKPVAKKLAVKKKTTKK
jgi:regulator of replication initiation timing